MSVFSFLQAFPSFQVLKIKEIQHFTTKQTFYVVITTLYFFYSGVKAFFSIVS